jgi:hypothetical protein
MRFWVSSSLPGLIVLLLLVTPVPGAAQNITVTATNPNTAPQDTIALDVTINGSGFKRGAKAKWFVTGTTNPGGVTVNSTNYVSSSQLIANITVAADAVISDFDVQVANNDGRTGVGIEAFTITVGHGANACDIQPLPAGITLVGTLNSGQFGPGLGLTVKAKLMVLGTRTVLITSVSSTASAGKLEIFFLDPVSGAVLDGQVIGSPTGQPQPHLTISHPSGSRRQAAGDITADGIPDFALASAGSNNVYAFVGDVQDGILSYQIHSLPPPEAFNGYGWSVAMGDLDGLPGDEVAAGAYGGGTGSTVLGKVFIFKYNGAGFSSIQTIASPLPNQKKDDQFGNTVAIADVAGDSRLDLIVGAPNSNLSGAAKAGRVLVFPGPVSATNYVAITSGIKDDKFGTQVAGGDVNGGFSDLLATTGWNSPPGSTLVKRAQVFTGLVSSGQAANYTLLADSNAGWTAVPAVSDVNGDALADVIIGTPNAPCGGNAYLYFSDPPGGPLPLANRFKLSSPSAGTDPQTFGWAVELAPGTRLFLVTDQGRTVNGVDDAGQVYVYKVN